MHAFSIFIFTTFLDLTRVALATPPVCLLSAMGVQPNPADLKALCGLLEPQVAGNITEKCTGDDESSAISIYASTCLASESVTISIATTTSSSASVSGTGKSKTSATTTGSATAKTTGTTDSSTATGTSSGATATSSKSAADSKFPQVAMALLVAGFAGQYLLYMFLDRDDSASKRCGLHGV